MRPIMSAINHSIFNFPTLADWSGEGWLGVLILFTACLLYARKKYNLSWSLKEVHLRYTIAWNREPIRCGCMSTHTYNCISRFSFDGILLILCWPVFKYPLWFYKNIILKMPLSSLNEYFFYLIKVSTGVQNSSIKWKLM